MVQNNPTQRLAVGEDPFGPQYQGPDVPMPDTAGDGVPHGDQDQDGQPDQGQQPNPEALGPGNQEGLQPDQPPDNNAMVGAVPPASIKQQ